MPRYRITGPNGYSVTVEAANPEAARYGAQQHYASTLQQLDQFGDIISKEYAKRGVPKPDTTPGYRKAFANDIATNGAGGGGVQAFGGGLLYGLGDEIHGAQKAFNVGLRKVVGQNPGMTMDEAYRGTRDAERALAAGFSQRHPVENAGLSIAGGALAPGSFSGARYIAGAKGVLGTLGRASVVGALQGGASGAGNADGGFGDRLVGAGRGGALGTAAAPLVVGGGALGGQVVRRVVAPVARSAGSAVSSAASTTAQALGGVPGVPTGRQLALAAARGKAFVAQLAQRAPEGALAHNSAEAAGLPITAAQAIGRPAMNKLMVTGRLDGSTPDALAALLSDHSAGTGQRVLDHLQSVTGISPEAVAGNVTAHAAQLRKAAAPLYDAAFNAAGPVTSPKLDALMTRPSMQRALNRAADIAQEEGVSPTEAGFQRNTETVPGGGTRDVVTMTDTPTMQTWDLMKRALGSVLDDHRSPLTGKLQLNDATRPIVGTVTDLRDELVNLNPAYGEALAAGGEPLRMEDAYGTAGKLMQPGVPARTMTARVGDYTPSQFQAHQAGVIQNIYDKVQRGALKLKDVNVPDFQNKIRATFPDGGDDFLARMRQELELGAQRARMMPGTNSVTFEGDAGSQAMDDALSSGATAALKSAAQGKPLSALANVAMAPLSGAFRGAQIPLDQASRDEVGRLLMLRPSELHAELNTVPISTPTPRLALPAPSVFPLLAGPRASSGGGALENNAQ